MSLCQGFGKKVVFFRKKNRGFYPSPLVTDGELALLRQSSQVVKHFFLTCLSYGSNSLAYFVPIELRSEPRACSYLHQSELDQYFPSKYWRRSVVSTSTPHSRSRSTKNLSSSPHNCRLNFDPSIYIKPFVLVVEPVVPHLTSPLSLVVLVYQALAVVLDLLLL